MKKLHFTAIGGAIMHQLALALSRQGMVISGSDDEINDPAKTNLQHAGLLPEKNGWNPSAITKELDAVVLGMHAKKDNPELLKAQELGIPILSFPQYVYEVSKDKQRIVVAGSHGKTTISSMIMHVLKECNRQFDYLVGAKVAGFSQSVKLSEDADLIILEGDEYPASAVEPRPKIFFYHPHISVLSGIAWDHVNVFPTFENYLSQFETYLMNMAPGARLFYNSDDEEVVKLVHRVAGHLAIQPYSIPAYHYQDGQAILSTQLGEVPLRIFGKHNLSNLEAAKSVCLALGVVEEDFYTAIATFTGAARRLEPLLEEEGFVAFRDFAHAPSKLKATLDAVREAYPEHRLVAVFELHTYSSLSEKFLNGYAGSMDSADEAMVYFSHHALQLKGLPGLDTATVKHHFGDAVQVIDDTETLKKSIHMACKNTDQPICLLLMSSGTFDGSDLLTAAR